MNQLQLQSRLPSWFLQKLFRSNRQRMFYGFTLLVVLQAAPMLGTPQKLFSVANVSIYIFTFCSWLVYSGLSPSPFADPRICVLIAGIRYASLFIVELAPYTLPYEPPALWRVVTLSYSLFAETEHHLIKTCVFPALDLALTLQHGRGSVSDMLTRWCIVGLVILLKDFLTSRKRLYKRLYQDCVQRTGAEAKKLCVQNRFIAALTHEMRNFVTTIVTNSEVLKETETWDSAAVNDLSEAAAYLSEILTNTLDISKLEEGKIEFNREFDSVHKVVDVVFSVARTNALKKNVKLESNYSAILPPLVEFDKTRLTQVVMNCVGNAVKFSKDSGRIVVKVGWYWNCGKSAGDCSICDGSHMDEDGIDSSKMGTPTEELKEGEALRFREYAARSKSSKPKSLLSLMDKGIRRREAETELDDSVAEEVTPRCVMSTGRIEYAAQMKEKQGGIAKKMRSYAMFPTFLSQSQRSPLSYVAPFGSGADSLHMRHGGTTKNGDESAVSFFPSFKKEPCSARIDAPRGQPDNFSQCFQGAAMAKAAVGNGHEDEKRPVKKKMSSPEQPPHKNELSSVPQLNFGFHKANSRTLLRLIRKDFSASQLFATKKRKRAKIQIAARQIKFKKDFIPAKLRKINSSKALRHKGPEFEAVEKKRRNFCNYLLEPPATGNLQIEIQDNGCGMTKEAQEHLFHPFSQGSKETYSKYGGTGLGMWISYKLVCAMGGKMSCCSIVDEGTTFTITVPTHWKNPGKKDGENQGAGRRQKLPLKNLYVLCLLKNPEEVRDCLQGAGCNVMVRGDIQEVVGVLQQHKKLGIKKQLVLAGAQAAAELDKKRKTESLGIRPSQIIVVTSKSQEDYDDFQHVITRPVNHRLLLSILEHEVRGQALRSEITTPEPQSPLRPNSEKSELKSFSLLIADDEELIRNSLQRQLAKFTKNATLCSNGIELVTLYKKSPKEYDLLIVDNRMPIMGGLETIRTVRGFEAGTNAVPIIFLTGDSDETLKREALAAGATYALEKPISSAELEKIVLEVCGRKVKDVQGKQHGRQLSYSQFYQN